MAVPHAPDEGMRSSRVERRVPSSLDSRGRKSDLPPVVDKISTKITIIP